MNQQKQHQLIQAMNNKRKRLIHALEDSQRGWDDAVRAKFLEKQAEPLLNEAGQAQKKIAKIIADVETARRSCP